MTKYEPGQTGDAMTDNGSEEDRSTEEDPLDPETRRIFEASMRRNREALERLAEL